MTTIDLAALATVSGGGAALDNMKRGALTEADRWAEKTDRVVPTPLNLVVGAFTSSVGAWVGAAKGLAHTVNPAIAMPR